MAITASKLRENIYKILDQVAETGVPVEVTRRRHKFKIVPAGGSNPSRLDSLIDRGDVLRGDPEDLVHMDWSKEWKP